MKYTILYILALLFLNTYAQDPVKSIPRTVITPHLQASISLDTNIIYCSTFQIVWNEFKREAKGDIELSKKLKIVDNLNKGENAKEFLSEKDYLIASGIVTEELVNRINKELATKFNGIFDPIDDKPSPNSFIFYSFLYKNLKFRNKFEKFKSGISFQRINNSSKVKGFGINDYNKHKLKHKVLKNQFEVFYNSYTEFIVKLKPKNKNDEIILAMIKPEKNMKETISKIDSCLNTFVQIKKFKGLRLGVPNLFFDIKHQYNELIGNDILNQKFKEYFISEALQDVLFQLDEKGAIVKSKAKIGLKYRSLHNKNIDYNLMFNRPFMLIIKEKNKDFPYMAVWVANENIMKPVEE